MGSGWGKDRHVKGKIQGRQLQLPRQLGNKSDGHKDKRAIHPNLVILEVSRRMGHLSWMNRTMVLWAVGLD